MPSESYGDPEGRRIARSKAAVLAEAGRTAAALRVLLRRAGHDPVMADSLSKSLASAEAIELQRANGRIEPRNRFKAGLAQPLLAARPTHFLFLDEAGKSTRGSAGDSPFFSLAGVALQSSEIATYVAQADELKQKFFGSTEITFHEPMMRNHDGPYHFGGNPSLQLEFDQAIDRLLLDTKFVAFGAAIRKKGFEEDFVADGLDPYMPTDVYALSITLLLERYIDFLAHQHEAHMGRVTFESQGPREDAEHQLEYARLLLDGTRWVSDGAFRDWLETGLRFVPKSGSHPVELADMFARELFEWVRGDCEITPQRWDTFSAKIHIREEGTMGKFGVKIFPDADIRDLIEMHRRWVSSLVR
jgi:hypothetical protein